MLGDILKKTTLSQVNPTALLEDPFYEKMGIHYLPHLQFIDSRTEFHIRDRCSKEERELDLRQKWLGSYYAKEIQRGSSIDIVISWISKDVGYGVFTNALIPKHAYVGEYTGIVRKKRFFGELKNPYCFDYTIAIDKRTPYVIDAAGHGNYTRYINHSIKENLETASVLCDGVMHIILYATQDIPTGSQLFYDYGPDYWIKRKKPIELH